MNKIILHQILSERFNEGELRTLCFYLGIDYENLLPGGKADKARELLSVLESRNQLQKLIEVGSQMRPDITWEHSPHNQEKMDMRTRSGHVEMPNLDTRAVRNLIIEALSDQELSDLCFDYFRPVYNDFAQGMTKGQMVQKLLTYCERQDQMDRLLDKIKEINPARFKQYQLRIYQQVTPSSTDQALSTQQNIEKEQIPLSPGLNMATVLVIIMLNKDFEAFTTDDQRNLIMELSRIVDVTPEKIQIVNMVPGSVILTLQMPKSAANLLLLIYLTNRSRLEAIGITNVGLQEKPTNHNRLADIAILTVLDEESVAVNRRIMHLRSVSGTEESPNVFGWAVGEIARTEGRTPYHVLLAQVAHAGNLMSLATALVTIQQWQPRYIFLVGIAGGLERNGLSLGDVVISDHIYGYEYGKILANTAVFEPRPDFTYRCDAGLINGTRRFAQFQPDWGRSVGVGRPDISPRMPNALWGPIASGEKVIDEANAGYFLSVLSKSPKLLAVEMEGVGVAAAVDQARALGYNTGFLMIRGISDMPSTPSTPDGSTAQRDKWKVYAAEAAATFTVAYISAGLPVPPASQSG